MQYTLAYLDLAENYTIQVIPNLSQDQVIGYLMQITNVFDLYEGMDIREAINIIADEFDATDFYLTVVSNSGAIYSL